MSRIELGDSMQTILIKMSEGNPGGLIAMMDLLGKAKEIDPQNVFDEFL